MRLSTTSEDVEEPGRPDSHALNCLQSWVQACSVQSSQGALIIIPKINLFPVACNPKESFNSMRAQVYHGRTCVKHRSQFFGPRPRPMTGCYGASQLAANPEPSMTAALSISKQPQLET